MKKVFQSMLAASIVVLAIIFASCSNGSSSDSNASNDTPVSFNYKVGVVSKTDYEEVKGNIPANPNKSELETARDSYKEKTIANTLEEKASATEDEVRTKLSQYCTEEQVNTYISKLKSGTTYILYFDLGDENQKGWAFIQKNK